MSKNVSWIKSPSSNPGPTTEEGKAISSRNAMKHGCCAAQTLLLPGESLNDLQALEATWVRAYSPATEAERHLLAELVQADWLLQRTTRAFVQVEAELYNIKANPAEWSETMERKFARHLRYRTAQTNLVAKARKAVEDYRKARLTEQANEQKQTIAQEKLKIYQLKNKPELPWDEQMAECRALAVRLGYLPKDQAPAQP